jgi:hypothetical protein
MRQLVVLDDSTILTLLNDPKFSETIPCLYNKKEIFKAPAGGCGACAQKRQERQRKEMSTLKSCLASMSVEKKAELHQLLDAEKIRVVYINNAGQTVQSTF